MELNKKQKELIKIFIFLFILSFIIINWDNVSWVFNYREVQGLVYDFFNPYPDTASTLVAFNTKIITNENSAVINNPAPVINRPQIASGSPVIASSTTTVPAIINSLADNFLTIPTINVNTPVVIAKSTDNTLLENDLDKGAVYYPGSVLPGQNGQIVILGHSSPPNWPNIKHDYIFSNIEKLNKGDQITLNFNNINYTYKVIDKKIIKAGQDLSANELSGTSNILTLISCWPPGKNYQRITVTAQLVS